jgi:TRAP-type C4-dicarboxylate transport system permease small subunit
VSLQKFTVAAGRIGAALETGLLVCILAGMMLLALGQIVLRNFFDIGLPWGDELLRLLVLWLGLAGALAASRADRHINVAVLDHYLPPTARKLVKIFMHLFTAAVCAAVAWFSWQFVLTSREYGDLLLGSIPAWWLQAALPLGFALMTWRYLVLLLRDSTALASQLRSQAPAP